MGTETEIIKGVFAVFTLIGLAICLLAFTAVILAMLLYLQCKLEDVARKWRENKASIKQWWSFRHWQYKVHDVTCTHTAAKAVIEELEKSDNVYQLDLDVEALETAIQAFKKRAGYPEPVELPSMPCERGIADSVIVCLHENAPDNPSQNQIIRYIQEKYDLPNSFQPAISAAIVGYFNKANKAKKAKQAKKD